MSEDNDLNGSISLVLSSRWYFRAYTILAVAAVVALMPFPDTSWIFYDVSSMYLFVGLAAVIWLFYKMEDLVSCRRNALAAGCFAWFHVGLSLALLWGVISATDGVFGHETAATYLGELILAFVVGAALMGTVRRAIRIALVCGTLSRQQKSL